MVKKHIINDDTARFWLYVNKTEACWLWMGGNNGMGYGKFYLKGKMVYAHRYSYEIHQGVIPTGLYLDHLCRVPACVNPNHLEPVTNRQNQVRGLNCTKRKTNDLPVGVRKHGRKFKATRMIGGISRYIGLFETPEKAEQALIMLGA